MFPLMIATAYTLCRWFRRPGIAVEPLLDHVVVELFGPEHAGECLAHDEPRIVRKMFGNDGLIELVSFVNARVKDLFEVRESFFAISVLVTQAQTDRCSFAGCNRKFVIGGGLCARLLGIHCLLVALNDV